MNNKFQKKEYIIYTPVIGMDKKPVLVGLLVICLVTMGSLVTLAKANNCLKICKEVCEEGRAKGLYVGSSFDACMNACPEECPPGK